MSESVLSEYCECFAEWFNVIWTCSFHACLWPLKVERNIVMLQNVKNYSNCRTNVWWIRCWCRSTTKPAIPSHTLQWVALKCFEDVSQLYIMHNCSIAVCSLCGSTFLEGSFRLGSVLEMDFFTVTFQLASIYCLLSLLFLVSIACSDVLIPTFCFLALGFSPFP